MKESLCRTASEQFVPTPRASGRADTPLLSWPAVATIVASFLVSVALFWQAIQPKPDGATRFEQECVVITTRLDRARGTMFVTCIRPAPGPSAVAAQ